MTTTTPKLPTPSKPGFRPLRACLAILTALTLAGCQPPPPTADQEVLLDTSASLRALPDAARDRVLAALDQWARQATTNSTFRVWVFPQAGGYPTEIAAAYTFPVLEAPAFERRTEYARKIRKDLDQRLRAIPYTHTGTGLLEGITHIAHTLDLSGAPYELLLVTDLLQSSPRLELSAEQLARHKDPELQAKMLAIAPKPKNAPLQVRLITYPGYAGRDPIPDPLHARIVGLFTAFFRDWSGGRAAVATESMR